MKILILGHGKYYRKIKSERNISADKDYYERLMNDNNNIIVTLDIDPRVEPDVVFDFRHYDYPFDDKAFDIIIDASGLGLTPSYFKREFWEEINRLLKLHGFFLGRRRSLFYQAQARDLQSCSSPLISEDDKLSDEVALINRHGLYEKPHPSNMNQSHLSLEKVHRPRYE